LTETTDNPHRKAAPLADPKAREFPGKADPGLAGIEAALTEVPGIGPWTALGFLIFGLDRPDVRLAGDLALRRAIERALGPDHIPTEDEMVQIAERWRPYRSLAVSYLAASEFEKGTKWQQRQDSRGRTKGAPLT
jgi:3-methyladenine DNA glycosylase/8-oxoguanine DNA glycosylase